MSDPLFIIWASGAVCSILDFPVQETHWYTEASTSSTSHHPARQEAGTQNTQGEAEIALLAQLGDEKAQQNVRNSS